jgi:hypothetical protein
LIKTEIAEFISDGDGLTRKTPFSWSFLIAVFEFSFIPVISGIIFSFSNPPLWGYK